MVGFAFGCLGVCAVSVAFFIAVVAIDIIRDWKE